MTEQSSIHSYLNWTKQRIDEMDAALASLEAKAGQASADVKTKSDRLIADLKKRRDKFQTEAKVPEQAGEAALQASLAQLESQWNAFDSQVRSYFETAGRQVGQQQATFRNVAAAQMKAWRETADKFSHEVTKVAPAKRADVDAALKKMKADAAEAEARLHKLKEAGTETWSALSAALADTRKAFDRVNQATWDAIKRATAPKTAAPTK